MDTNKLYKLLETVDGVQSNRWYMVQEIVDSIKKGHAFVIEKHWSDKWKEEKQSDYYPLKLDELSTWSTFDYTCIEILFKVKDSFIICTAKIYYGNIFGGHREREKFYATILINPSRFIKKISALIENKIDNIAHDAYQEFLEKEKLKWVEEYKRKIIES